MLRALNRKQHPCPICPLPDKNSGKLYTGQGYLKAADKEDLPLIVDEYTSLRIKDGYRFELDTDEVDAIHWKWARRHPYIELTKEMAKASPDAVFYIENKEAEAEAKVKSEDLIIDAKYMTKKATIGQRKELCEIFHEYNAENMTDSELLSFLLDKAALFPKQVLNYFDPTKREGVNLDLEIAKLRKAGVIWRAGSGTFKFGDRQQPNKAVNLGRSEDKVKEFMLTEDNHSVVEEMRMVYEEITDKEDEE